MRAAALALLFAAACFAQGEDAVKWSLRVEGPAKPGAKAKAILTATIADGWHLYSMKEIDGGPRPTRITVSEDQPFTLAGNIEAPGPVILHDPNFDMDVEFYAESADFMLPLAVAADARPGSRKLTVVARYQVCNDKLCLPPKNVTVEAPVELK